MQFMLGDSLFDIGQRESGTARLEEATASFRLGLEVVTRDRAPLDWAIVQVDLAMALGLIGDR
ncbi:MAG: hypothetical protein JOY66_25620 [Acetobacteraceae bacterium]|nr:hypothetical protein [Acetobacteraceae bacterium]